jgi:hypothetical protein
MPATETSTLQPPISPIRINEWPSEQPLPVTQPAMPAMAGTKTTPETMQATRLLRMSFAGVLSAIQLLSAYA